MKGLVFCLTLLAVGLMGLLAPSDSQACDGYAQAGIGCVGIGYAQPVQYVSPAVVYYRQQANFGYAGAGVGRAYGQANVGFGHGRGIARSRSVQRFRGFGGVSRARSVQRFGY